MKKSFILVALLLMILFTQQTTHAEVFELIDEDYNFKNISKILVISYLDENYNSADPYIKLNFPKELIAKLQKKTPAIVAHTMSQAQKLFDKPTDLSISLTLDDEQLRSYLVTNLINNNYDAVLTIHILEYDYQIKPFGKTTPENPWGLNKCSNVRIEFALIDIKSYNQVLGRSYSNVDLQDLDTVKKFIIDNFATKFKKLTMPDSKER